MGWVKSETLVEAVSVKSHLVSCKLDETAPPQTTLVDGPGKHCLSDSLASAIARDADCFDLATPSATPPQARNEGQLQGPDDPPAVLCHCKELISVGFDCRESRRVACWKRCLQYLSRCTDSIVRQKRYDVRNIAQYCFSKANPSHAEGYHFEDHTRNVRYESSPSRPRLGADPCVALVFWPMRLERPVRSPPITRLATYGTLSPGRENHNQLAGLIGRWQTGTVTGWLFPEAWGAALGYPGLVLDPEGKTLKVQLFQSDDLPAHWARLDTFEGEGYRRAVTLVATAEGLLEACIYVLTGDVAVGEASPPTK